MSEVQPHLNQSALDQLFDKARVQAGAGLALEAVTSYRQILHACPDNVEAHYKLGALFLEIDQPELAIPHLKKAYEGRQGTEKYWSKYATGLLAAKRPHEARAIIDEGMQQWGFLGRRAAGLHCDWTAAHQAATAAPSRPVPLPDVADTEFYNILSKAWPYSMSSVFGLVDAFYSLYQCVEYIVSRNIPGAFVECGTYMGGMSLLAALTFMKHGDTTRELYLFDTFEGMPPPTQNDGPEMARAYTKNTENDAHWAKADIHAVGAIMRLSGYPPEKIHLVKGIVEDTVPQYAPKEIAILRLDTDLYSSYKHALTHLYPRLAKGGALVLDDYGFMPGARQAVDEFFSSVAPAILLNRVNFTVRTGIKS